MYNDKRNRPVCLVHCKQKTYDHFVGECGIDNGGPRREFFPLLAQSVVQSPLLCGVDASTPQRREDFYPCNP